MKGYFRILRHSFTMVGRTLRSYALLSVTIVLSFSLLLGYLLFVDSQIYNDYKNIFQLNRGNLKISEDEQNSERFDILVQKASQREDTCLYVTYNAYPSMSDGQFVIDGNETIHSRQIRVVFLSGYVWEYFYHFDEPYDIQWLDGGEHEYVDLAPGEAILDTGTFYALGLDALDEPEYTFRFNQGNETLETKVKIVGLIDLPADYGEFFVEKDGRLQYNDTYPPIILLPIIDYTEEEVARLAPLRYAIFYSENPDIIYGYATDLGFKVGLANSAFRWQDSVLETIRGQKSTKALITCAMLLILGINLYSSFSNALNKRKFEIGVKRAIGASGFAIVRQFLYESITVMVANILVSIALVTDIGLLYKLVMEEVYGPTNFLYETYTLYLSPYSIGMFLVCAVTLTVVFSLIFAYKSTQVQVIDYLKAE